MLVLLEAIVISVSIPISVLCQRSLGSLSKVSEVITEGIPSSHLQDYLQMCLSSNVYVLRLDKF